MRYWGLSDKGMVRSQNQDTFFAGVIRNPAGEEAFLGVVCDGMGGAKAGDLASSLAKETFVAYVSERFGEKTDTGAVLRAGAEQANRAVLEKAAAGPEFNGMGTTLVAVLIYGEKTVVANVGDSRCYIIRDQDIRQITKDHSLVEDMIDKGELSREEAWKHPRKNLITRAIGTEDRADCDLFEPEFLSGDHMILCSDGLSNIVNPQEMLFEVLYGGEEDTAARRMMDIALGRNASDNVTVVLLAL